MRKAITLILALALAALAGCAAGPRTETRTPDSTDGAQAKIVVAVTIVPEATFVQAVCGDLADVVTLVPPGASPETYEPLPEQMEGLGQAALYFAIGVPVEDAYILSSVGENTKVVSLDEAVAAVYEPRAFEGGEPDPHIWLSPKRAKVMIETIAREMGALDPDNAQLYKDNAKVYNDQLDELDAYIRGALADAPGKAFIAYHPSFGYFADDYGITMYALEEEGKEATPQHMQEVIDLAREKGVKVIFYQAEMDSRQSAQFAEEIGGTSVMLSPLSADYINNLIAMTDAIAGVLK